MARQTLRIALLHLAPVPGDLTRNRRAVESAVSLAAQQGATWILTPELSVCGYTFADQLGTDWIQPQPDQWMIEMCRFAARRRTTLFLSHPERDRRSNKLFNSLFVITPNGRIAGSHRKINTLRVGSESWSSPGDRAQPVLVAPFTSIGLLICADAFSPDIARTLKTQGAQLLLSSAAWAPGLHGPNGEWERCTSETGLPLLVCNRTGPDRTLDFTQAESVVVKNGRRLLSLSSERPAVFLIEWDLAANDLASPRSRRMLL